MRRFRFLLFSLLLGLFMSAGNAALPLAVDGNELPSLAPMLVGVQPAIVNISTTTNIRVQEHPLFQDPFFRRFYNLPRQQQRPTSSLGSGVIVDAENGYVVTNHHVIDKADEITVTTKDGRELEAVLVGSDAASDVAVIQVDSKNLTEIKLGVSEQLRVGDFVVAIGSPFGLSQTVTSGIVSALGRSGLGIEGYEDFIQTDASINPGNSGGALVNLRGELVGINTAILSRGGGSVGIGLSIPVDMVKSLMQQLLEHGEVKRGLLGVRMQDLTPALADAFGISGKKGTVVSEVIAGSAAEEIGIKEGDVIVRFNDTRIEDSVDLRNAVGLLRPGSSAVVEYYRDGSLESVEVKIRALEDIASIDEGVIKRLEGARFKTVEPDTEPGRGVLVFEIDPASAAASSGLEENDVIVSINRREIASLEDMKDVVKRTTDVLLIKLIRNGRPLFLVIQ
jgi:serine protease Do/serine protease DegQ